MECFLIILRFFFRNVKSWQTLVANAKTSLKWKNRENRGQLLTIYILCAITATYTFTELFDIYCMSNLCQILYNASNIKSRKGISLYLQEVSVGKEEIIQCRGDIETKRKKSYKTLWAGGSTLTEKDFLVGDRWSD